MSVSAADVRRVAALARLGLDDARVESLVAELNGILAHMAVLGAAAREAAPDDDAPPTPSALRPDEGPAVPLARPPAAFAPDVRDGFVAVPRLASHAGGEGEP